MGKNVRGQIMTRAEISRVFGISKTTLDRWTERGCPCLKKSGRKGSPSQYDSAAVFQWAMYHREW